VHNTVGRYCAHKKTNALAGGLSQSVSESWTPNRCPAISLSDVFQYPYDCQKGIPQVQNTSCS
jgi:hypothetical protein